MKELSKSKLDGRLDEILEMFYDGMNFRSVAKSLDVSVVTLNKFLSREDNIEEYKIALQESSDSYSSKAEDVLLNAESDKVEISRARELAQHYRWMAAKRNPRRYGDKIDVTTGGDKINSVTVFELPNNNRDVTNNDPNK